MESDRKIHWESVYDSKDSQQMSWTQEIPKTSLDFIRILGIKKDATIIDVGGGDSKFVDFLIDAGYENITVLDISAKALEKAKKRLGIKATRIKWVVSDITEFEPKSHYDVWHDRATFHFLTEKSQITNYIETVRKCVNGHLIIGTFSDNGPKKCSGLDIRQYTEETLMLELKSDFEKIKCIRIDHVTPFDTKQNFIFCGFKKIT
jgi:2-polyprenyl-3-methyl-5-hydroxy-6-metoxy-1,4-benzoquinol methylase